MPEEEFPSLARFEEVKIFTIAQKGLKDGLKKTSYAISVDETRYVLNGILFQRHPIGYLDKAQWSPHETS
jgi:DNA polymerase-3 subunit beta